MISFPQARGLPALVAALVFGVVVFMFLYLYFPAMSVSDYRRAVILSTCPKKNGRLRIACVGDSITYGNGSGVSDKAADRGSYPKKLNILLEEHIAAHPQLAQELRDGIEVRNYGVRSATAMKPLKGNWGPGRQLSYWTTEEFQQAKEWLPHVVVLMLGTNDSKYKPWIGETKAKFQSDYKGLVEALGSEESNPCIDKIWVAEPPTLYSSLWGLSEERLSNDVIPLIKEVAKELDVDMISVRQILAADGDEYAQKRWFCMDEEKNDPPGDGVHPCRRGTEHFASGVAETITRWMDYEAED